MKRPTTRAYPDLKTWRGAKGFNQREAADFLGISQNFYCRVERGLSAPRGPKAKLITARTGVPLEVLVGAA